MKRINVIPSPANPRHSILFITGTDTGVGKTVLAALLLRHLRRRGFRALAIKPFCSGGLGDVRVLQALQPGELADGEMNPWHYPEPVSPWAAQRAGGRRAGLGGVLRHINLIKSKCDILIVEMAGGLLAPLGPGWTALDLIRKIRGFVAVVAPDRLGCLNHAQLTVKALSGAGVRRWALVLMGQRRPDASSASNRVFFREKWGGKRVFEVPYLGRKALAINEIERKEIFLKKTLARLAGTIKLTRVLSERKTAEKNRKKLLTAGGAAGKVAARKKSGL